jgi:hypothetical protein
MKIQTFLKKYPDVTIAEGCSEPGYDDKPVILTNWNNIPSKVFDSLESQGYSCEWEDEWTTCDECGKAFRTSPNCYGWQRYGIINTETCEVICGDCLKESPQDYLKSLENDFKNALTTSLASVIDVENYGYKLVENDFQHGFYGQMDNPEDILKKFLEKNPQGKYLFVMTAQGQFATDFAIYEKVKVDEKQ